MQKRILGFKRSSSVDLTIGLTPRNLEGFQTPDFKVSNNQSDITLLDNLFFETNIG